MDQAQRIEKKVACAADLLDVMGRHDPAIAVSTMIDVIVATLMIMTLDREDLAWQGLGVIEKDLRSAFAMQLEAKKKLFAEK